MVLWAYREIKEDLNVLVFLPFGKEDTQNSIIHILVTSSGDRLGRSIGGEALVN